MADLVAAIVIVSALLVSIACGAVQVSAIASTLEVVDPPAPSDALESAVDHLVEQALLVRMSRSGAMPLDLRAAPTMRGPRGAQ